jgi:hypothetical protein
VRVAPFLEGELPTGRGVLSFFPVDNTLGNRDPVVGRLMRQVCYYIHTLHIYNV